MGYFDDDYSSQYFNSDWGEGRNEKKRKRGKELTNEMIMENLGILLKNDDVMKKELKIIRKYNEVLYKKVSEQVEIGKELINMMNRRSEVEHFGEESDKKDEGGNGGVFGSKFDKQDIIIMMVGIVVFICLIKMIK